MYYAFVCVPDESCSSSPKSHQRSQSDAAVISHIEDSVDTKKESDKKMVKNILSHLLPSSSNAAIVPVSYKLNIINNGDEQKN